MTKTMFQVGDIVVGLDRNFYSVTGPGSINEVIEINNRDILVVVVGTSPNFHNRCGECFPVDPQYFALATNRTLKGILKR